MRIGSLTVWLEVPGADSLKDKRQVVRSLLEQTRRKFNVSAAEVDQLDSWRHATLGFAIVSNDGAFIDQVFAKLVDTLEAEPRSLVIDTQQEIV
ncbi:MAG: DUF503 domain-containing protein [Capsulimonadaceae bacterium]|nr:DUF503 domain-containing protein [Capsulimonadaceae bacterium]